MDPSCGDGRFLTCAVELGAREVVGCDLDSRAVNASRAALAASSATWTVLQDDFFAIDPAKHPKVDIMIGNPPFIRFQNFTGDSRRRALESALQLGVHLTALSSAWAPFVIHAIRFLRQEGVMAMVVPAEIAQTNYGLRTLEAMCQNFARVHLIAFARNFFDDNEADTYLLLAERAGHSCRAVDLHPLDSIDQLAGVQVAGLATTTLPVGAAERVPFALAFLTPEERDAWQQTSGIPGIVRVAEIGKVTNGYVTGANDFFLLTRKIASSKGLSASWLRRTAVNAASFRGLRFTRDDIAELDSKGHPHHLLDLPVGDISDAQRSRLRAFLSEGEARGIPGRFKCRTRDPWWRVPGIHTPHLFLPYMIGRNPISSVNAARATYTNTIHGLRLHRASEADAVAIGLHSTLSLLSMELQGRTYGGGVLKLEPSEMERVSLAVPGTCACASEIDRLLRSREYARAVALADDIVLRDELGLSSGTISLLQAARNRLVARRYSRNPKKRHS
jgi:predicted RNA methylase